MNEVSPMPAAWPPNGRRSHRAVILAGGEAEAPEFVRAVVTQDDILVAADGGSRLAVAASLVPHLLVGDVDSLSVAEAAALPAETLRWIHPPAKDFSDLELAIRAAHAADAREIVVLGALGGRLDHLLVNVGLLHLAHALGRPMRLLSERGEAFLLLDEVTLAWEVGRLVTLIAVTEAVHGLSIDGFEYETRGAHLPWGSSRGLSNVVMRSPARIRIASGRLLVVGGGAVGMRTEVTRTHLALEAADAAQLSSGGDAFRVEAVRATPGFYRYLYGETGRAYHWVDRAHWTDARLEEHLADPSVSLWVMVEDGAPAGWFELKQEPDAVHIAYFGLLPGYLGRGLGGHLLSAAIERARAIGGRILVNTCSLDDRAALPNYLARGFRVVGEERYFVQLQRPLP